MSKFAEQNYAVNFSTLHGSANECEKLILAFNERYNDLKSKQTELNISATPSNLEPADVPHVLQLEIIQL